MYLQKLEIQGFKSFANKSKLEFTSGITAIVGPNGSGKSNIADAVRWVLGEQSLKILRGKKSDDIIFSGSDKKARLGLAEVSLFINNEDGAMPIDYREVAITRRLFRDGESEYLINKNKVRLQDIILLLAKSHFGQRSYSVIGQGMIDSILVASAEERKNFFDEAAGVRQYQLKKEQALQKLAHTKENLTKADILIQEIEPRLRSLTRQVRKLARREEIEKNLRALQEQYYSYLWLELKSQDELASKNAKKTEEELESFKARLSDIQNQIKEKETGGRREDLFRSLQSKYNELLGQKNDYLVQKSSLDGKLEVALIKEGGQNLVWLEKQQTENRKIIAGSQSESTDFGNRLVEQSRRLELKTKELASLNEEASRLADELESAKERLERGAVINLPEIQKELDEIIKFQEEFIGKLLAIKKPEELSKLQKEGETINQRLKSFSFKLKGATATDPKEILAIQAELNRQAEKKEGLIREIGQAKLELSILEERQKIIKASLARAQAELEKIVNDLKIVKAASRGGPEAKTTVQEEKKVLENKIQGLDEGLAKIQKEMNNFNETEQLKKEELIALQREFQSQQDKFNRSSSRLNEFKVELARLETKREDLDREIKGELPEELRKIILEKKDASSIIPEVLLPEIQKGKHQLELVGGLDESVSKEYETTKERFDFLSNQSSDLKKAIDSLEKIIEELDEKIKKQFSQSFEKISQEFGRYFKLLFDGGVAKLILQKEVAVSPEEEIEEEIAEEELREGEIKVSEETEEKPQLKEKKQEKVITGIEIQATPPGKRLKNINMLSGGEKALTSIALICSIIANNPSPFVILDEVDAALDESNSIKFASILKNLSQKTQFITITHNRATMKEAGILYGVTMGDEGISKLLSLKMEEAEKAIQGKG